MLLILYVIKTWIRPMCDGLYYNSGRAMCIWYSERQREGQRSTSGKGAWPNVDCLMQQWHLMCVIRRCMILGDCSSWAMFAPPPVKEPIQWLHIVHWHWLFSCQWQFPVVFCTQSYTFSITNFFVMKQWQDFCVATTWKSILELCRIKLFEHLLPYETVVVGG